MRDVCEACHKLPLLLRRTGYCHVAVVHESGGGQSRLWRADFLLQLRSHLSQRCLERRRGGARCDQEPADQDEGISKPELGNVRRFFKVRVRNSGGQHVELVPVGLRMRRIPRQTVVD